MAPAVFVRKKSEDLWLCIDRGELNTKTPRDAYPLPLLDEIQSQFAKSTIFSTLDLHSGYWKLPISVKDREKTAFCPAPGMGLYHFCCLRFGLAGAPESFQRLMDKILRGLPFASTYIDDILAFSPDSIQHKGHLCQDFNHFCQAGLILWGKKCHIGTYVTCNIFRSCLFCFMHVSRLQENPSHCRVATAHQCYSSTSVHRLGLLHTIDDILLIFRPRPIMPA